MGFFTRVDKIDKILKSEECLAWNAALLDCALTLKLLPVDQSYGPDHLQLLFSHSGNRFDRRLPARDHILHYQHPVSPLNVTLNMFLQAMLFGFLSHDECSDIPASLPVRNIRKDNCERIGPYGHATHRIHLSVTQAFEHQFSDQFSCFWIREGRFAVDVVPARNAGGERVDRLPAVAKGFFEEDL